MKRVDALVAISRRHFCSGVACLGAAAVASCIDGNGTVIQTGALGSRDGGNRDPVDAPGSGSDAGSDTGAACPATGATDVGAASAFVAGTPQYFSAGNFFVVRDSGGLYALTARCTHQGETVVVSSGEFLCHRHGALFDFDGNVTTGPAYIPLPHYAMCTISNGHVGVITSQTVPQAQRLDA